MDKIFLTVPFKEKEQAKSLGARWDATEKQWYVPAGFELATFSQWLSVAPEVGSSGTVIVPSETDKGIRLAVLLSRISQAVVAAMPHAEWVMAEIGALQERQQNIYLDLVEHDAEGKEIAKTRGTLWKSVACKILAKFKEGTGADLAAGIKVMVKVQAQFNGQYGLSLNIVDIDPSYTMGDMAAKLRRIRESLIKEGIYASNQLLAMPRDFFRVAIVSPEQAAGLSDFRQEANLLAQHDVCRFDYFSAVFQGERASTEILRAIGEALSVHATLPYDAIVIIRGGGNVADLNWLNSEELARRVCLSSIPVFTGIGHSTDSTILDEVACRSFDTPSKVIVHILQTVGAVVEAAQGNADDIFRVAQRQSENAELLNEREWRTIRRDADHAVEQAALHAEHRHESILQSAMNASKNAASAMEISFRNTASSAESLLQRAEADIEAHRHEIRQSTVSALDKAEQTSAELVGLTVVQVEHQLDWAAKEAVGLQEEIFRAAQSAAEQAEEKARDMIAQVIALGPMHTLSRGFTIVRSEQGVVTSAAQAGIHQHLEIQFADGNIKVQQEKE